MNPFKSPTTFADTWLASFAAIPAIVIASDFLRLDNRFLLNTRDLVAPLSNRRTRSNTLSGWLRARTYRYAPFPAGASSSSFIDLVSVDENDSDVDRITAGSWRLRIPSFREEIIRFAPSCFFAFRFSFLVAAGFSSSSFSLSVALFGHFLAICPVLPQQ